MQVNNRKARIINAITKHEVLSFGLLIVRHTDSEAQCYYWPLRRYVITAEGYKSSQHHGNANSRSAAANQQRRMTPPDQSASASDEIIPRRQNETLTVAVSQDHIHLESFVWKPGR